MVAIRADVLRPAAASSDAPHQGSIAPARKKPRASERIGLSCGFESTLTQAKRLRMEATVGVYIKKICGGQGRTRAVYMSRK